MANPTLGMILADARRITKTAQAKKADALAGVTSMPGSEHDSATPADAKTPDKETKDGTMVPNSGLSTAGAGKPDITDQHALEVDQPAETPKKKPLDSADAEAKEAEATAELSNDILKMIRGAQRAAAAPAAPVAEKVAVSAAAVEKGVVEKGKELAGKAVNFAKDHSKAIATHGGAAAAGAAGGAAAMHAHDKKAEEVLDMELTTDIMAKVAALILSTEEGAVLAEQVMAKQAGAEFAQETLAFLAGQSALAEKAAAYEAGQRDAQALVDKQIFDAGVKAAQAAAQASTFRKMGQAAADASIADMVGAGGVGGAAPEAAAAGAGDAGAGAPEAAPAEAGEAGGQEISMEDIVQALQALVKDGTLQPEEAEEVLKYLTEGGEAGAAPEGAAPEAAPEGAAPEAAPGGEPASAAPEGADVNKEAAAPKTPEKSAGASLIETIRALKAGSKK